MEDGASDIVLGSSLQEVSGIVHPQKIKVQWRFEGQPAVFPVETELNTLDGKHPRKVLREGAIRNASRRVRPPVTGS